MKRGGEEEKSNHDVATRGSTVAVIKEHGNKKCLGLCLFTFFYLFLSIEHVINYFLLLWDTCIVWKQHNPTFIY